jgi:small multidrug resistance pump
MEVSVAYAVWSAVGTALVTMLGVFLFKESVSLSKVFAIVLIILGVVTLNLSDRTSTAAENSATAQVSKAKGDSLQ